MNIDATTPEFERKKQKKLVLMVSRKNKFTFVSQV